MNVLTPGRPHSSIFNDSLTYDCACRSISIANKHDHETSALPDPP